MVILDKTIKYRVETEQEAEDLIKEIKEDADKKGYSVNKISQTKKVKKKAGEIIAECWLVVLTKIYEELWYDM